MAGMIEIPVRKYCAVFYLYELGNVELVTRYSEVRQIRIQLHIHSMDHRSAFCFDLSYIV